jgi:hypothetical protein
MNSDELRSDLEAIRSELLAVRTELQEQRRANRGLQIAVCVCAAVGFLAIAIQYVRVNSLGSSVTKLGLSYSQQLSQHHADK